MGLFKFLLYAISAIGTVVVATLICSHIGIETPLDKHVEQILHNDPDVRRLITSEGYPFEEHTVETQDGFLLTQHRVKHGRDGSKDSAGSKRVVLLVHGLMAASDSYFINLPEQSLGFMLADAGFDVWVANLRGTRYSSKHKKYHYKDKEFSDFSFDEMARYDLPAVIDQVLRVTGSKQIYYIGMSQGAMVSYALLSERPEYNNKIKLNVALCPVAYVGNISGIARTFFLAHKYFVDYFGSSHLGKEHLPTRLHRTFCKYMSYPCFYFLGAYDKLNKTRQEHYWTYSQAGTSSRSIAHIGQNILLKTFSKYDFGPEKNMLKYGQATPPEYDMSRVTAPTLLVWSSPDKTSTPDDIATQASKLPNLVRSYRVEDDTFTHLDFAMATTAGELVHKPLLKMIEDFDASPKGKVDKVKTDGKSRKENVDNGKTRDKSNKDKAKVKAPQQNAHEDKSTAKTSKSNVDKDKASQKSKQ